ncbi:MAG: hypothetical protein EA357_10525 [Micavibrio sp.]|nr:MAG: hypothetical protein EA357_10525 [Micavibrio sp.]
MKTEFPVKLRKKPGQKVILFFVLSWAAGFSLSVLDMTPQATEDFAAMLTAREDIPPAIAALLLQFGFWSSFFYWLPIVIIGGSFGMRHRPTLAHVFGYIQKGEKSGDDFLTFIEKALEDELEKNLQNLKQLEHDIEEKRNYSYRPADLRKLDKSLQHLRRYEEKRRYEIQDQLKTLREERKLLF